MFCSMNAGPDIWDVPRIVEFARTHVVLARDEAARPVPVPIGLEGLEAVDPATSWHDDLGKMDDPSHARTALLWWQAMAQPGQLHSRGVRLRSGAEMVWHRVSALNLLHDPAVGVVLMFIRSDPSAQEPSADEGSIELVENHRPLEHQRRHL